MPRSLEQDVSGSGGVADRSTELVGGQSLINPVRDRYWSDQFHVNFGTERLAGKPWSRDDIRLVHCDCDFFKCVHSHVVVLTQGNFSILASVY